MSYNPTVIIPGIGQSKVDLVDSNGNRVDSAWPISFDFKNALADLKGPLAKMMLFRKDAGFSDKIADMVDKALETIKLNPDGTVKHNLKTVSYNKPVSECTQDEKNFIYTMVPMQSLAEITGEDKLYFYAFHPFGDAYEIADGLDEYIQMVKKQTGAEKVNLIAVSLGGVILRAYLDKYADKNDIDRIANIVAALDGTYTVSDIFRDRFKLDDLSGLLSLLGGKGEQLAPMLKMIPADVIDNCIEKVLVTAKNAILYPCTLMWACIPNALFDEIAGKYLVNANPVLKEKVMRLHNFSVGFGDKMKEMQSNGVEFCFCCGYGKKMFPFLKSENENSDTMINIQSASYGATAAPIGSKLDARGEYVSPDGSIDASTCVLKDNVWFFYDQQHDNIAYNDVALAVARKFLTKEIDNIHSDPKYPQFNNTRNLYSIRRRRIPEMNRALESGKVSAEDKAKLDALMEKYNAILENTFIKDNADVDALNEEFKAVLEKYN